jgi:hypothetical protein
VQSLDSSDSGGRKQITESSAVTANDVDGALLGSEDPIADAQARSWEAAKDEMLEQFLPDARRREDFRKLQLRCRIEVAVPGGFVEAEFDLSGDLETQSHAYLRLLRGGEVPTDQKVEAIATKAAAVHAQLQPLIEAALGLFEESLWHYWRDGDYVHWPTGQRPEYPGGFESYSHGEGALVVSYPTIVSGWRAYVAFDSADYPALDAALRDMESIRTQFMLDLEVVASSD